MRYFMFLVVSLVFPMACHAGEVPYSAMVLAVKGKVEVQRDRKKIPVDLGCLLYAGDRVETATGASVTINYLGSGQEEQWPGKMRFTIDKQGSRPSLPSVQRKSRKVVLAKLDTPQAGSFRLRGAGQYPRVTVKDLSNVCALEERPAFRWSRVDGADRYQVTLSLSDGNRQLWRKVSVGTELPYPATEAALDPDTRYRWDVEAIGNGRVMAAKRSCFYLPGREAQAAIRQRLQLYRQQLEGNPADSAGRLDMIFFLEGSRLYAHALEQYAVLRRINGESESLRQREENLIRLMESDCTLGGN